MSRSRILALGLLTTVGLLALVQLVPYGRDHANPPEAALVTFDSPQTQRLAERACFDCHSRRTRWPWYASIAPISWRVQSHVDEGRAALDFTAFDPANEKVADAAGEASEAVAKREMPPFDYRLAHPEARLTAQELQALQQGLDRTFAAFSEGGESAAGSGRERGNGTPGARDTRGRDRDGDGDRD